MKFADEIEICGNCGHFARDHNERMLRWQGRSEAHCAFASFHCPCPGFVPLGDHDRISPGEPCPPRRESP